MGKSFSNLQIAFIDNVSINVSYSIQESCIVFIGIMRIAKKEIS